MPRLALPIAGTLLLLASHALAEPSPAALPPPPPPPAALLPAPVPASPGLTLPPPSFAQRPPQRPSFLDEHRTNTRWYGWQILAILPAFDGLMLAGLTSGTYKSLVLSYIGAAGHVLTGPIVHWGHGHAGTGFVSLALNGGLPILGYAVGDGIDDDRRCAGRFCGLITVGAVVTSIFTAAIVDIAVLANDEVPVQRKATSLLPRDLVISPLLGQSHGAGVSLSGRF